MGLNSCAIYIEERLSEFFGRIGLQVATYPAQAILLSLSLCLSMVYGLTMIKSESKAEILYSPSHGNRARDERDLYQKFFRNDSTVVKRSSVLFYAKDERTNLLDVKVVDRIRTVHDQIVKMEVVSASASEVRVNYSDVCQRSDRVGHEDECWFVGVVELKPEELLNLPPVSYFSPKAGFVPVATFAGGRQLSADGSKVERVRGWLLHYPLSSQLGTDVTNLWEDSFLELVQSISSNLSPSEPFKLAYEISRSDELELSRSTSSDTNLLVIAFAAVGLFSFGIMHSFLDRVASKGCLSFCACGSIALAIGSAFGLMGYCGVRFNPVVAFVTFLLLGLGVDDSYVLVQAYHCTAEKLPAEASVRERVVATFRTAGVSIFFTSVTDFIAFAVGASSSFPSVQGFCAYAAAGVVFLFIHQLLFFGAFLALDAHREYSNLSWFWLLLGRGAFWSPPYNPQLSPASSGYLAADGTNRTPPELVSVKRFSTAYGNFLLHPKVAPMLLLAFLGYVGVAMYGAVNVGVGLDLRDLAASDSYWTNFVTQRFLLFNDFGPLYLVALPAQSSDLSVPQEREKLLRVIASIENDVCFVPEPQGVWLREFYKDETRRGIRAEALEGKAFEDELRVWLGGNGTAFLKDFVIDTTRPSEWRIEMTRFKVRQIPGRTTSGDKTGVPCLKRIRSILDDNYPHELRNRPLTVDTLNTFVFWEASAVIVEQTILNLVYAAAACFFVTIVIIPHPILCLIAMVVVSMILLGTLGSMTLITKLRIETISMIDLVLAIGFSIDNVAHYIHAFMTSQVKAKADKASRPQRQLMAIDALERIGMPILAADLSTMIALLPLLASKSRIFYSFFCILFTVLLLGGMHAVVFLPLFLGYFGPVLRVGESEEVDFEKSSPSEAELNECESVAKADCVIVERNLAGESGRG